MTCTFTCVSRAAKKTKLSPLAPLLPLPEASLPVACQTPAGHRRPGRGGVRHASGWPCRQRQRLPTGAITMGRRELFERWGALADGGASPSRRRRLTVACETRRALEYCRMFDGPCSATAKISTSVATASGAELRACVWAARHSRMPGSLRQPRHRPGKP